MEVNVSPDLEAKLARIANLRGCDAEAVAPDAIEQVVNQTSGSYERSQVDIFVCSLHP
jgi:hypothetical protein